MSVREDLAAAASTVPGVRVRPYFVASTDPGHGYVRLDRIEYPNTFGGVCHWQVLVVLPQDYGHAERKAEEWVDPIREAIGEHMVVTTVLPQRLDIPQVGVVPCLFFNGHREKD